MSAIPRRMILYSSLLLLLLLLLNRPITIPFDWYYNNGKLAWFSLEQDPEAKRLVCWTLDLSLIQSRVIGKDKK